MTNKNENVNFPSLNLLMLPGQQACINDRKEQHNHTRPSSHTGLSESLPITPHLPASLYKHRLPPSGAYNHTFYMKSNLYSLSSAGVVTRRLAATKKMDYAVMPKTSVPSEHTEKTIVSVANHPQKPIINIPKPVDNIQANTKHQQGQRLNRAHVVALLQTFQDALLALAQQSADVNLMQDESVKSIFLESFEDTLIEIQSKLDEKDILYWKTVSFDGLLKNVFIIVQNIDRRYMKLKMIKEVARLFYTLATFNNNVWRVLLELDCVPWLVSVILNIESFSSHQGQHGSKMIDGGKSSEFTSHRKLQPSINEMDSHVNDSTNSANADAPSALQKKSSRTFHRKNQRTFQEAVETPLRSKIFSNEDTLVSFLLKNYVDSSFIDDFEKYNREQRKSAIKGLLILFTKVGKLLTSTNYISMELNINTAIDRLTKETRNILDAERCLFYFVDEQTGEMRSRDFLFVDGRPRVFSADSGIIGYSVKRKESINVEEPLSNPHFDPAVDSIPGLTLRNLLVVPIIDKNDNVKAVITAMNKLDSPQFSSDDLFLLKHIASQAAVVMENAKSYDTIQKTQKKVEVLLGTTKSLSSELELGKLIQAIMQAAKELLNTDLSTLFLVDHEKKELWSRIRTRDGFEDIRFSMDRGIAGHVATTGETVNIADAYKDPRFNPSIDKKTGYRTKSILCMPIRNVSGKIIGVTQMINKFNDDFSKDDEQLMVAFSAQAAVAIEKSYLFKKTEEMRNHLEKVLKSITDCVLTLSADGLLLSINHQWFIAALGRNEAEMRAKPVTYWLGENNTEFLRDIQHVYTSGETAAVTDYELKAPSEHGHITISYRIMPLIGDSGGGVVVVMEDLSKEKRMMNTLGRYMAPQLVKQVMAEGGNMLGGHKQNVSVLFTDIRSFTALTESMEPTAVIQILNRHFSDIVNAILSEHGILDKFIGDAAMAVFGVPYPTVNDAINACNAALLIKTSLKTFNDEQNKLGLPEIKIGIGINTGEVLSGNIGSQKRMEYTVIGDNVNLASRTEGLSKHFKVMIIITQNTVKEIGDNFIIRELDTVIVVGKKEGIQMYELVAKKDDVLSAETLRAFELYRQGLKEYRSRNFIDARNYLGQCNAIIDDGPSKLLMERCTELIDNPPPPEWIPCYNSTSK